VALLEVTLSARGCGGWGGPATRSNVRLLSGVAPRAFSAMQAKEVVFSAPSLPAAKARMLVETLFEEKDAEVVEVKIEKGEPEVMGAESLLCIQEICGEGKPSAEHDRVTLSPATATTRSEGFSVIAGNTGRREKYQKNNNLQTKKKPS